MRFRFDGDMAGSGPWQPTGPEPPEDKEDEEEREKARRPRWGPAGHRDLWARGGKTFIGFHGCDNLSLWDTIGEWGLGYTLGTGGACKSW